MPGSRRALSGKSQAREKTRAVSDGRTEIFDDFARSWEPVNELDPAEHVVVDTSESLEANLERLARELEITREER